MQESTRPVRTQRQAPAPEVDSDILWNDISKETRLRLRTLSKENAEYVGPHLVMVERYLDIDPDLAYEHAKEALRSAGRVDAVREALALAAYATGRYQEALHELRTVRRLNGSSENLALMADCERGLGRPERAIALSQTPEAEIISSVAKLELLIVVAGARADLGEAATGLISLERINLNKLPIELQIRVIEAQNYLRDLLGRELLAVPDVRQPNDVSTGTDFVVFDLGWGIEPDDEPEEALSTSQDEASQPETEEPITPGSAS